MSNDTAQNTFAMCLKESVGKEYFRAKLANTSATFKVAVTQHTNVHFLYMCIVQMQQR